MNPDDDGRGLRLGQRRRFSWPLAAGNSTRNRLQVAWVLFDFDNNNNKQRGEQRFLSGRSRVLQVFHQNQTGGQFRQTRGESCERQQQQQPREQMRNRRRDCDGANCNIASALVICPAARVGRSVAWNAPAVPVCGRRSPIAPLVRAAPTTASRELVPRRTSTNQTRAQAKFIVLVVAAARAGLETTSCNWLTWARLWPWGACERLSVT